jgi:hypothetical protein
MSNLRTAAQQALDALESGPAAHMKWAITALRDALAEPVEYAVEPNGKRSPLLTHMMNKRTKEEGSALTEEKPVAYWIPKAEQFCFASPTGRPFAKAWEPLYTAPPQRKPLTDEEIYSNDEVMECNAHIGAQMNELIRLVRAIERAHGIKENT